MASRLSEEQVQLCLAMTEASARDLAPDASANDFTSYARAFTALGHPPDFDPRASDADSAGALDILLLDSLSLAAMGQVAFHVLGVLIDLGIEKAAETGTERFWHRFRHRRRTHESSPPAAETAVETPEAARQLDAAGLVTEVTSRLSRRWTSLDGATIESVIEVQVKAYLREHGTPGAPEQR